MGINWEEERKKFPVCENSTYLRSSAVGPLPVEVRDLYVSRTQELCDFGEADEERLISRFAEARSIARRFLNAESEDDIAFAPNTSHGMNLLAMMTRQNSSQKSRVLCANEEFPSSTLPWIHHGFEVDSVPHSRLLERLQRDHAALVVSAIQYSTGHRMPLIELGSRAKELGVPFFVNATQAIGAFPIPLKEASVSAMTASCHKWLCAGYGVSLFYTQKEYRERHSWPLAGWLSVNDPMAMENQFLDLKETTSANELGVPPFIVVSAVAEAMKKADQIGIENIAERIWTLSHHLEKELLDIGLTIRSERDQAPEWKDSKNSGTLLVDFPGIEKVEQALYREKIYPTIRQGGLRISTHYFNNKEDIDRLIQTLKAHHPS